MRKLIRQSEIVENRLRALLQETGRRVSKIPYARVAREKTAEYVLAGLAITFGIIAISEYLTRCFSCDSDDFLAAIQQAGIALVSLWVVQNEKALRGKD